MASEDASSSGILYAFSLGEVRMSCDAQKLHPAYGNCAFTPPVAAGTRDVSRGGWPLSAAGCQRRQATFDPHPSRRTLAQDDVGPGRLGRDSQEGSYLQAQFLRLKSGRGPKKATLAVAASMLTAVYLMLRDGVEYDDLGPHYFAQRDKEQIAKRLLRRLRDLGVNVEVKAA